MLLLFEGYFSLIVLRFGASTGIQRQQEKYQSASPCLFLGRVGRDFRLDFIFIGEQFFQVLGFLPRPQFPLLTLWGHLAVSPAM